MWGNDPGPHWLKSICDELCARLEISRRIGTKYSGVWRDYEDEFQVSYRCTAVRDGRWDMYIVVAGVRESFCCREYLKCNDHGLYCREKPCRLCRECGCKVERVPGVCVWGRNHDVIMSNWRLVFEATTLDNVLSSSGQV